MAIRINKITDTVYVKNSNGQWQTDDDFAYITGVPQNDTQIIDDNKINFQKILNNLKEKIKDVKEKAELYKLEIETEEHFLKKVEEYRKIKKIYDIEKKKLGQANGD